MRLPTLTTLAVAVALAGASLAAPKPVAAESFPERPIRVIVPFAAGGMSDSVARLFERTIQQEGLLPQPLTIVNVPGGGATIGTRRVHDSPADGHTIVLIHLALLSANALGLAEYGHEAFEPIAQTGSACLVVAVPEDSPYETLEDLFETARAAPDTVTEAVNLGAVVHIASLILSDEAGTRFRYVQTGGGAERFQSLIGGHTETAMFSTSEYQSFKPTGLRGLGLLADERHPDFPDLPTARELGYDVTFCVDNWWFAPAGTPQERIDMIADALEAAMATEQIRQAFDAQTLAPTFMRGEALAAHVEEVNRQIQAAAAEIEEQ